MVKRIKSINAVEINLANEGIFIEDDGSFLSNKDVVL